MNTSTTRKPFCPICRRAMRVCDVAGQQGYVCDECPGAPAAAKFRAMVSADTVQGVFENCPHSAVGVLELTFAGTINGPGASIARGSPIQLCAVCGCWRLVVTSAPQPSQDQGDWNVPALWASVFA